jgi:cobalt-precorrin 5A hydrolase/precorrin-3B C17-methyltransferase
MDVDPALGGWPLPDGFSRTGYGSSAPASAQVAVTDRDGEAAEGQVVLRPPSLVLGVGSSTGADPGGLHRLALAALAGAGLSPDAVGCLATLDRKAHEPAIVELAAALGVGLRCFPAEALAATPVPNPSPVVDAAVGTPSVAEAAALAAAGPGAALVVEKQRSADATVAVARRARPDGHLAVVGLGPGDAALRTPAATAAVRHADAVVGYGPYVDLVDDLLTARQAVVRSPIGAETERCREALRRAAAGETVALVCSGDPGVYAMASLVCELAAGFGDPPVTVVPGVTAALAAAAVLGAPLGHDHAAVSLSDLLTPWPLIEQRLQAVADGDFTVSLYNPRSKRRTGQLDRALAILAGRRPPGTPAAIVTDAGRPGQRVIRTTLADLDPEAVDMLSLVVIGSTTTRWLGDRMVTPRGYRSP